MINDFFLKNILKKLKYDNVFFKNDEDIETYQNLHLELIKKTKFSFFKKKGQNFILRTSGTTSGFEKQYLYTLSCYEHIENYHISRIMHFNKIKNGNIIFLKPSGSGYKVKDYEIYGPNHMVSLGNKNNVYFMYYSYQYTTSDWNILFENARKINPVFIYAKPSEVILLKGIRPQNYPIILTCETLHDHVRILAKNLFSSCIDKMRCWDGGCSFFECSYGTKHINDELSIVKTNEGRVTSTDLFNFSQPFINYENGDFGKIQRKQCECGIYGSYFEKFYGKIIEQITTNSCKKIFGTNFVDYISSIKKRYDLEFNFSLIQKENKDVDFFIDRKIEKQHLLEIKATIMRIINDNNSKDPAVNFVEKKIIPYKKQLLVRSKCI